MKEGGDESSYFTDLSGTTIYFRLGFAVIYLLTVVLVSIAIENWPDLANRVFAFLLLVTVTVWVYVLFSDYLFLEE